MQKATAQSGIYYCYDAAGNRAQRSTTSCANNVVGDGGSGSGDDRMLLLTDSATNASGQALTEALYPNPTGGPVSVVFNNAVIDAQVTIIDYLGRQLYTATVSGTNIPLDLSHYNDGVYMIVVRTGGNSYESTVVKE